MVDFELKLQSLTKLISKCLLIGEHTAFFCHDNFYRMIELIQF